MNILLLEDDAIEIMKFNSVIKKIGIKHKIVLASDGQEALSLLANKALIPDIIISDINMPKVNGIEFLREIKQDDTRKFIPTIMLTTSSNPKDIKECYQLGVSSYMLKPLKHNDYVSNTTKLIEYWSANELVA